MTGSAVRPLGERFHGRCAASIPGDELEIELDVENRRTGEG